MKVLQRDVWTCIRSAAAFGGPSLGRSGGAAAGGAGFSAAGGAEGAEALSGISRAFFYAGTRALLVSHWEGGSDAAVKLRSGGR